MRRLALVALLLLGAGCSPSASTVSSTKVGMVSDALPSAATLALPVSEYHSNYKHFGERVQDRFSGYHTGEDVEFSQADLLMHDIKEVPVYAIADGTVSELSWVSGYGGVMIVRHQIDGKTVSALYGHIDKASATVAVGDAVRKGEQIAVLGADKSEETDGERQHLHFALWNGDEIKLAGYVSNSADLSDWLNPHDMLLSHGALPPGEADAFADNANFVYPEPSHEDGTQGFIKTPFDNVAFELPELWDVQWVASDPDVLTLYAVSGEGSADSRSQMTLRAMPDGTVVPEQKNAGLPKETYERVASSVRVYF